MHDIQKIDVAKNASDTSISRDLRDDATTDVENDDADSGDTLRQNTADDNDDASDDGSSSDDDDDDHARARSGRLSAVAAAINDAASLQEILQSTLQSLRESNPDLAVDLQLRPVVDSSSGRSGQHFRFNLRAIRRQAPAAADGANLRAGNAQSNSARGDAASPVARARTRAGTAALNSRATLAAGASDTSRALAARFNERIASSAGSSRDVATARRAEPDVDQFSLRTGTQPSEQIIVFRRNDGEDSAAKSSTARIMKPLARMTHFIPEANVGRGFIKEVSFSNDGRIISSPFGFGVRLLAFDQYCNELSDCVPAKPLRLYEVTSNMSHRVEVVTTKFSPTHNLLVSGCLDGKIDFHQPVL